jgi:hypothetical protein
MKINVFFSAAARLPQQSFLANVCAFSLPWHFTDESQPKAEGRRPKAEGPSNRKQFNPRGEVNKIAQYPHHLYFSFLYWFFQLFAFLAIVFNLLMIANL